MAESPGHRSANRPVTIGEGDIEAVPAPWDYNPSDWPNRRRVAALGLVAAAIAAYMGLYQWGLIDAVWDPVFGQGSQQVLDSTASEQMRRVIGLPDSVLGAVAYLSEVIFALAGSTRRWQYRPWLVMLFGIDVIPLGLVSVGLVVLQGTSVGAWCFLCLVTAAISLILVLLAYDEVWSCLLYLRRLWQRTHDWGIVWAAFWGRPTPAAAATGRAMVREAG
jgi:Vitamin K epoxide reductase family